MIKPRQLSPLFLALVLTPGAMGPLAQPAPTETTESPPEAASQGPQKTVEAPPAPAQTSTPPTTGVDSPFEYRPSEEISEDVSVSFPVDI